MVHAMGLAQSESFLDLFILDTRVLSTKIKS